MENINSSTRQRATIFNFERKAMYVLDPESRQYMELASSQDILLALAGWIARPPRMRDSGKTVNIFYETVDTGERRQMFGREAEHLLTRERHRAEPGACEIDRETDTDGWYIPVSKARAIGLRNYGAYISGGNCRDTVVKHGEALRRGFPLSETTTTRYLRSGDPSFSGATTREVLELSTDPLDKNLFEIPDGFKKVDSLPGQPSPTWSDRLQMEWAQLERAVQSWFE